MLWYMWIVTIASIHINACTKRSIINFIDILILSIFSITAHLTERFERMPTYPDSEYECEHYNAAADKNPNIQVVQLPVQPVDGSVRRICTRKYE